MILTLLIWKPDILCYCYPKCQKCPCSRFLCWEPCWKWAQRPTSHWTYMQAYGAPRNVRIAWHKCKVWLYGPFDSCKGKPGCLCLILQHSLTLTYSFVGMHCKPAHWNYQNWKKESNLLSISQFMVFPCARCVCMYVIFFLPLKFE